MEESEILSFVMWSAVTGIVMAVSGYCYDSFLKKRAKHTDSKN